MSEKSNTVFRLELHQLSQAAQVLGRAFRGDPGFEYLVPDEVRRAHLVPPLFGASRPLLPVVWRGLYHPGGGRCGLPASSRQHQTSLHEDVTHRPTYRVTETRWAGFLKLMYLENYLEKIHRRSVPEPHWYLWWLGVDPAHQGQSIGRALIQPVLERAEAESLPCYLETDN